MNYAWHTRINFVLLTCLVYALIKYGFYEPYTISFFWIHGMLHTVLVSPDIDHPRSTPTRRLGLLGKITSTLFTHRGITHNPYAWSTLYMGLYIYLFRSMGYNAWWFSGGLVAIYSHVIVDIVSTAIIRKYNKIKRTLSL